MKYTYLILLLFLLFFSCKENRIKLVFPDDILKEHNLKDSDLRFANSIKLIDPDKTAKVIINDSLEFISTKIINRVEFAPFETIQAIQIVRDNVVDFLFYKYYKYSTIEKQGVTHIEYPLDTINRQKMMLFILGYHDGQKNLKSAYIKWSSKAYNEPPDYMKKTLQDRPYNYLYLWGINFLTDSITTNLSLKSIKLLYPDFEGVYVFKKYKRIILDHNYSTFDRTFFKHIEFVE